MNNLYKNESNEPFLDCLENMEVSEVIDLCNAPYAKKLMGEELCNFVIKAMPIKDKDPELYKKMKKELHISNKLKELEQDFN